MATVSTHMGVLSVNEVVFSCQVMESSFKTLRGYSSSTEIQSQCLFEQSLH